MAVALVLLGCACLVPQPPEPDVVPAEPPPTAGPVEPPDGEPLEPAAASAGGAEVGERTPGEPLEGAAAVSPASAPASEPAPEGPAAAPDLPTDPAPIVSPDPVAPAGDEQAPTSGPEEGAASPAAGGAQRGDVEPPPPPEILDVVRRYYAATTERDWAAAKACFWEGATITSVRSPGENEPARVLVQPADEVLDRLAAESNVATTAARREFEGEPVVRVNGEVAQVARRYIGRFGSREEVMQWRRFDAFTLVYYEDLWKIAALVQGSSKAGP